ncbi:MAG: glycerol kinase [Chlamydiae bacterium RIFCSPHIGHO2_12_FULL_49_9]|nr:MAG: glycerol kinase [Chlamydiae bacterium RIFCSPHIGHO2_12_FULL_49_9]
MAFILALDQGTTSSRALVIDSQGAVLSLAQKEFKQYFPSSGLVEHDPEEIWSTQLSVATEALAKANLNASQISGIGITNQRETTILWDRKTGHPLFNAIVWQDRRTTPLCEELKKKGLEPLFKQKTGLLLDPYFSGTKLHWLLENVKGARALAEKGDLAFGTVDTWLIWKLTNGLLHITDATNASRTLLYNIHEGKWDEELLKILNIPVSLLPQVKSSSEVYGTTGPHIFTAPIPISGIAGDQQAALFAQGCTEKGRAKSTYGTGCFILMHTGTTAVASKNQLITTIALQIGKKVTYALEGSVFSAGSAVQWFRDNLGLIKKSSDINDLAATVSDSGGVYFVSAFTGLGAPHWDPHARGAIFGISRGTTAAHLARAVLEGIAFQAADVLKAMEGDSKTQVFELRVDGGAASSDLLMQIQADLMDTTVLRPKNQELTALGAAFLAGLGTGIWKSEQELASLWQIDRKFTPRADTAVREKMLSRWNEAIERSKNWENH